MSVNHFTRVIVLIVFARLLLVAQQIQAAPLSETIDIPMLKLPAIFTDNMALQQNQPIPIWGWSKPGVKVAVKFSGQTKTTQADADGHWLVMLDTLSASTNQQQLAIEAGETKVFDNMLAGEVCLCSGQLNMIKPFEIASKINKQIDKK